MEIEILNEEALRRWCGMIEVQPGAVSALARVAQQVRGDELLLAAFTDFYRTRVVESAMEAEWPRLVFDPAVEARLGQDTSLFYLLAYLSALPRLAQHYVRLGIGMDIFRATLLDVSIWLEQYHLKRGYWGFDEHGWISLHLAGWLFRLGRLQFMLGEFRGKVRAFRCRADGRVLLLGDPEQALRPDGSAWGAGRPRGEPIPPVDEGCWQAEFSESEDGWRGNPITPVGRTARAAVTLRRREWDLVLQPGDRVLDMHIPRGPRLDEDACRDSLRQAHEFFARVAPEKPFQAVYCHTWFFTPQLQQILPPESNLVRFQREFYLFPFAGGPGFLWDYVFGPHYPEPAGAPRDTALRRATLDWLDQGGEFFDLPGVAFHGPDEWGAQPYYT